MICEEIMQDNIIASSVCTNLEESTVAVNTYAAAIHDEF